MSMIGDDEGPKTPVNEAMARVKRAQERKLQETRQPLNPDRDFSWDKTTFENYEND